ncbi:MAG: hypothetical protein OHK0039_36040 [Bacteroidia bacterium]
MRKPQLPFLLALAMLLGLQPLVAQQRYLDQVFTSVSRTDGIVYGNNISVLTQGPQDLVMEVYRPENDSATDRPLVILATTGNFLPPILNGSPTGSYKDSTVVELAIRLAKHGYVVASIFYRQGWDALNPSQEIQTATLLQAAYRGIQDARTAIRFFRKDVAENGNTYGIDPDRIVVGGVGTGGYVSLGSAYFDDYEKVKLPKFTDFTTGLPYVDTTVHGNIYATNTATLSLPNHVGYSSDFNMVFNIGGALGDTSWLDPGDMPYVGFHTPQDPFAPYDIGVVIVPTTGNTVIDQAAGSYGVAKIVNTFGNNDLFVDAGFSDVFTQRANVLNDGYEGLFAFDRPFTPGDYTCSNGATQPLVPEGSPWSWWNEAVFIATWDAATGGNPFPGVIANCRELRGNPDMSPEKGRRYVDSIESYLAPRMYLALDLSTTSIENDLLRHYLSVYPNPAQSVLFVKNDQADRPIQGLRLLDLAGRTVYTAEGLAGNLHSIPCGDLSPGMYLLQVRTAVAQTQVRVLIQR